MSIQLQLDSFYCFLLLDDGSVGKIAYRHLFVHDLFAPDDSENSEFSYTNMMYQSGGSFFFSIMGCGTDF